MLTASISIAFRAFLSRSAEVIKKEELHVPIQSVDPKLSADVISFLKKVKVSQILPLERVIIP